MHHRITHGPDQPKPDAHMKTPHSPLPATNPMSWLACFALLAVTSLIFIAGATARPNAVLPAPTSGPVASEGAEATDAPLPFSVARAVPSCAQCGIVTSLREMTAEDIDATGNRRAPPLLAAVRQREVTVHLRDGSHHIFRESGATTWRIGERMIIIGGAFRTDA